MMKLKKFLSLMLGTAMLFCCFMTGCGDDEKESEGSNSKKIEEPAAVADELVSIYFNENAKYYFGMSEEKLNGEFDDTFTEKKADKADVKSGSPYYRYKLENIDSILNGKVDLGEKTDAVVVFMFDSEGKGLERVDYSIEIPLSYGNGDEFAEKICDELVKALRNGTNIDDMEDSDRLMGWYDNSGTNLNIEAFESSGTFEIRFKVRL